MATAEGLFLSPGLNDSFTGPGSLLAWWEEEIPLTVFPVTMTVLSQRILIPASSSNVVPVTDRVRLY